MTQFRTLAFLAAVVLLAEVTAAAPASHRKGRRTTTTADPSSPTAASPSLWSKKTALAPLPDSELVPFVTSRVERVPKPEDAPASHRRSSSKSRTTAAPSADNSIEHDRDLPKPPKASKGSKQASRRRWGPDAYNLFADAETHSRSPYAVLRKVPTKYVHKVQLPYQRSPPLPSLAPAPYDSPSGSVTSSTISVSPVRYKIIDMGDPWVTWSHAHGFNPHEPQRHQGNQQTPGHQYDSNNHHQQQYQHFLRPNRQEAAAAAPGVYGPEYGVAAYGGGGFYRPQAVYGPEVQQAGAYSGLHDSVIDPFQREHYGPRDVVPWSVQVGTSLTVKDDGRRSSSRQYYVQSQRRQQGGGEDDLLQG